MPLLVVPLGRDESPSLTLREWDALTSRAVVVFEREIPELRERLAGQGISVTVDPHLSADRDDAVFVVDPRSPRLVELAKAGATVTSGQAVSPDDLSAAYGAYLSRRGASSLAALAVVMARLRGPDGCPWDQEQTHGSLRVHLLEEAHEVLEAIDEGRVGEDLAEELGDLLLQVAFHSQLAADDGRFDLADVADRIVAKLVHRHPHVFGDTNVADASEVVRNWETIKAAEKSRGGPFDGIPAALPALLAAYKTQKRAAALGFQAGEQEAVAHLRAALNREPVDVGGALLWLVAVARARGIDPEGALREATRTFRHRWESP